MARADISPRLARVDKLVVELKSFVPIEKVGATEFRADLAGLLVVAIAASYEACVKETLVNYAASHHVAFGNFATNNYEKLNSRININDLNNYAKIFDRNSEFSSALKRRKKALNDKIGLDIQINYENILRWRHAFAHAWRINTTIEEAFTTHNAAKRVIFAFNDAFA